MEPKQQPAQDEPQTKPLDPDGEGEDRAALTEAMNTGSPDGTAEVSRYFLGLQ